VADTERVRLYAGGALICSSGVTLGTAVDTYSADNTLDDYEEGTFTPVLADAATGGNTASPSQAEGWYIKVGTKVTVNISFTNINTTGMTSGNIFWIRNLPFTSSSSTYNASNGVVRVSSINFTDYVTAYLADGNTYLRLFDNIDSGTASSLTVASILSGNSDISITMTYSA
jgi:hypothetical protein